MKADIQMYKDTYLYCIIIWWWRRRKPNKLSGKHANVLQHQDNGSLKVDCQTYTWAGPQGCPTQGECLASSVTYRKSLGSVEGEMMTTREGDTSSNVNPADGGALATSVCLDLSNSSTKWYLISYGSLRIATKLIFEAVDCHEIITN